MLDVLYSQRRKRLTDIYQQCMLTQIVQYHVIEFKPRLHTTICAADVFAWDFCRDGVVR